MTRKLFDPEEVRARLRRFQASLDDAVATMDLNGDVREALHYLNANFFDHDLSAGSACAACSLRDHNVTSVFKTQVGVGMAEYITGHRMRMAKILLIHFDLPIMEIRWLVGYGYPETFARAFRRVVGESPSAVRRSRRQ